MFARLGELLPISCPSSAGESGLYPGNCEAKAAVLGLSGGLSGGVADVIPPFGSGEGDGSMPLPGSAGENGRNGLTLCIVLFQASSVVSAASFPSANRRDGVGSRIHRNPSSFDFDGPKRSQDLATHARAHCSTATCVSRWRILVAVCS